MTESALVRVWLGVLLLSSVLACAKREAAPAPRDAGPPPPALPFAALPRLIGEPPEPSYAEARGLWRTATTAYARHEIDAAAHGFLGLTEKLWPSQEHPQAATFRAARCVSYENAAAAAALAKEPAAGEVRALLAAAKERDQACEATLTQLLSAMKERE